MGSGFTQFLQNFLKHQLRPQQHIIIPEADDAKATCLYVTRARCIVLTRVQMLTTIKLDNETRRHANKIRDVSRNRILSAEFEARKILSA